MANAVGSIRPQAGSARPGAGDAIEADVRPTVLYLVTEDWYFWSHRAALARAARAAGLRVVVATRVGAHRARIVDEGFELHALRLRRSGLNPLRELAALWELVKVYREVRADIVHHVALKPVIYGSIAARLTGRRRTVNALAGLGFVFASDSLRARLARPLVRAAYRWALASGHVIVQNAADRELVLGLGVAPQRVALIAGSGVDTDRYRPGPEPDGPIVVTLVSRMLADKGVLELVDAARRLARTHPRVRVRLVGPTDEQNPAAVSAQQLRAWAQEGIVEWCAGTDHVESVWAESHIAVLPSYREGLPKSLLEAAACGRPLVATDVPGCNDIAIDGQTGLLVPARDSVALAAAIARLVDDAELRARLGRGARERVERLFTTERVVEQTLSLYRRLLEAA